MSSSYKDTRCRPGEGQVSRAVGGSWGWLAMLVMTVRDSHGGVFHLHFPIQPFWKLWAASTAFPS